MRIAAALSGLWDPRGPVVTVEMPPPPEAGAGGFTLIALLLFVVSLIAVVRRRRRAKRAQADGESRGVGGIAGLAAGASVGNAMLDFGAFLDPGRPDAAVIRSLEEEPVEDAIGDGRAVSPIPAMPPSPPPA